MTGLSSVDKYRHEDPTLNRLLDLHEEIMEMGRGYWVEISAVRVEPSLSKPQGVDYSLCLLDPNGGRLVCYDNSHPVSVGRPPSRRKSATNDHRHFRTKVGPYNYVNAEVLMEDFWTDVFNVLKEEGIP